jgi:serine/threonine protein kinase
MLTPTNKLNNNNKNITTTTTTTTTTDKEKAKYVWDTSDIALAEVDQSYIFSVLKKKCYEFPLFSNQEIHTGKILGKGGFSNVYEIINIELLNNNEPELELEQPIVVNNNDNETKNNYYDLNNYSSNSNINLNLNLNLNDSSSTSLKSSLRKCHHTTAIDDDNNNTSHYDIKEARLIMKQHVTRFGLNRYAIKRLRPDLKSELDYARGSIDLAIEIKFMSVLVHPNIVKMRGISNTIQTAEGGRVSLDTFIIMDRLYGTLEDKINTEWMIKQLQINMDFLEQSNSCCSFFCGGCFGNKTNKNNNSIVQNEYEYNTNQLLKERLLVAYDLTVAFQYMHSLRLVYRDIKPQSKFLFHGKAFFFFFSFLLYSATVLYLSFYCRCFTRTHERTHALSHSISSF